MRLSIGCDHAGFDLKRTLLASVLSSHDVVDLGAYDAESVDYPDIAALAVASLKAGDTERSILICGTGIGMAMSAGRHAGIRAALCSEPVSAELSRRHNDANVLCLGGRMIGAEMAERIVRIWLDTPFDGGRHVRRVNKIEDASHTCD